MPPFLYLLVFLFDGNNQVLAHSLSYPLSRIYFARQITATYRFLKWQTGDALEKTSPAVIFWLRKAFTIMKVRSESMVKLPWMWAIFGDGLRWIQEA